MKQPTNPVHFETLPRHGHVAYFSMEIAINPGMPTYSGGLGILAGDTLRSGADLRVPMVAFTLLHRKGYFQQHLDQEGGQSEQTQPWNPADFCIEVPERVTVSIEDRVVIVRAWRYDLEGRFGFVVGPADLGLRGPEHDWAEHASEKNCGLARFAV